MGYHNCVNSSFCGLSYEDDGIQCRTDAECRSGDENKCVNNTCQCETDKSCQDWSGTTDQKCIAL